MPIKHSDYLQILNKLCDKGYNDRKFFSLILSNLQHKFDKIRSPNLTTQLLSLLFRCKTKFKPMLHICTNVLNNEMESRIGSVFLDKNHIQDLIKSLMRYIAATGHSGDIITSIFEVIIDGYIHVPIPILVDILYNLSVCHNIRNLNVLSYQEHDHNTPKQHFLVPIARFIHRHELRPIDKAKLFRCYVLFDFDHITFTKNVLLELNEVLKASLDFEDFDHYNTDYLPGFTIDSDSYTKGQILIIADSLLLSRRHHFTRGYKELVQSIYFNCLDLKQIDRLDSVEIRCAMSIIGNSTKYINPDQEILSALTRRMIDHLECNRVDIGDFSIFLKDLVRTSRVKLVRKNERNRTIRTTKFSRFQWIIDSSESEKSLLERISRHLTPDIDIVNLTHCLRSIAYLGYRDKEYYGKFLVHFRDNVDNMPAKCIAYIEQTLNKVKLNDKHTFYILGKRFQELQLDSEPKILLRRIG